MKAFFEKLKKFFVKNKVPVLIAAAVLFAAIICFVFLGRSNSGIRWPKNALTNGVPEFEGEIASCTETNTATAVYFKSVYREQADAYAKKLEDTLSIKFGGGNGYDYPVTAEYKNVFITLAYDASDLEFSVTFSEQKSEKAVEEERRK